MCVWIVEKFRAWTDDDGDLEDTLTRDQLLDDVMLYWLPGTGASSAPPASPIAHEGEVGPFVGERPDDVGRAA